jgi:hypothetical protein
VTLTLITQGLLYTIFGLGVSHAGWQLRPSEKACPAWPMGSNPRPVSVDHCQLGNAGELGKEVLEPRRAVVKDRGVRISPKSIAGRKSSRGYTWSWV